ncbi:hypothetical protein [Marispirochaeta aestuarii]|uniref:hypothetical protein n=1 Tax=Marispirochaeta aestuarii TaxID=1963862 RepID=UPI0029C8CE76|nr:hypothetical protein [Marispirochaeta aestuarii]
MAPGKFVSRQVLPVLATVFILSCTSLEQSAPPIPEEEHTAISREIPAPLVFGRGLGSTGEEAVDAALRDGARKVAEALLGPGASLNNQDLLDQIFSSSIYNVREAYYGDSIEILGTEKSAESEETVAVVRGRVNVTVLISGMREAGIPENLLPENPESAGLADEAVPGYADAYLTGRAELQKTETDPLVQGVHETAALDIEDLGRLKLNEIEKERLARFLNSLSFMILSSPSGEEDSLYRREAAFELSRVLSRYGYTCHYPDQVDGILAGQQETYREETGGDISLLQWTAKKLGADIYAQVNTQTDVRRDSGGFYASASVRIDLLDTQNWEKAASITSRELPPAFSTVSEQEAVSFALRSVMLELAPDVVSSAREAFSGTLIKGLPYQLILLSPPEQGELKRFLDLLEGEVRRIRRISSSSEEERFELRFLGSLEELESLLYDVAGSIDGMEDFSPAYQRGNTLAFYTGLF